MKMLNGKRVWNTVIDLTGQKFGKLTALDIAPRKPNVKKTNRTIYWNCICDCGGTKVVSTSCLKRGVTQSCGCMWRPRPQQKKYVGEISGQYWSTFLWRAAQQGWEMSVSQRFAWDLFLKQNRKCVYTGIELVFKPDDKNRTFQTASLDRIDSKKGYTEDNVQWVHKDVQRMKNAFSEERFLELIELIYNHRININANISPTFIGHI